MDMVYLDNNATTKPAPEVVAAMVEAMEVCYANPSSMHRAGQAARQRVDKARNQVAGLVNCLPAELIFTGGGTEAINTAIKGLYRLRKPRNRVIISAVEHSATLGACDYLRAEGAEIIEIGVDSSGALNIDQLKASLTPEVALVSIMWANNETGVLFDPAEIAACCKAARVPFHCDATQAVGKIPVDFKACGAEILSFAAHKFHGPKGVGGLVVRRGVRMASLVAGGPQESGRRGGTENVPGIVGAGVAADLARAFLPKMKTLATLRDELEQGILDKVPGSFVNGSTEHRLPNTTNIGFSRLESEAILLLLSERGICASAGAACSSGSLEPSHVLRAMGIEERVAHGAIRFSLSRFTTDAEIDRALEALPGVIGRLRAVLPVG
jgi:cysteine desulfurase